MISFRSSGKRLISQLGSTVPEGKCKCSSFLQLNQKRFFLRALQRFLQDLL